MHRPPRRTAEHLSRRALLRRALGGAVALPFLGSLTASLAAGEGPTTPAIPKRLVVVYVPHGIYLPTFLPPATGRDFALPPTLAPLEPLKGRFSVVGNLAMDRMSGISHRAGEMFLTNDRQPEGFLFRTSGLSMDRLVIDLHAGKTLVPSLELSLSPSGCQGLRNTMSFDAQGSPYLGQHDPRAVFDMLYGTGSAEQRRAELREQRSILDGVVPEAKRLGGALGTGDRRLLDQYLEGIRATEGYLERLEKRVDQPVKPEDEGLVFDPTATIGERMKTMLDVMYLALRADLTRVITFTVFKERADAQMAYPDLGLVGEHHAWSHGLGAAPESGGEYVDAVKKVDLYHCTQVARFIQRLRDTPEGNGTMLDNTVVVYGSGLALYDKVPDHEVFNLPILVAGGEAMGLRQGQYVRYEQPTNLANLNLTLLRQLGVQRDQWKDSTGVLSELLA